MAAACSCSLIPTDLTLCRVGTHKVVRSCLCMFASFSITYPENPSRSEDEVNERAPAWDCANPWRKQLIGWSAGNDQLGEMLSDISRTRSSRLEVRFGCELASGRLIPRYLYPFQLS